MKIIKLRAQLVNFNSEKARKTMNKGLTTDDLSIFKIIKLP